MYFNIAAILHFSKNVTIIVPSNNKIKTYNLTSCHMPKRVDMQQKVGRSHRTDKDEFYQTLSYKDDVNLEEKLQAWENFYNCHRSLK
jgi:hypothetical protein